MLPISISFCSKHECTPELLLSNFEKVLQSYNNFKINQNNSLRAVIQIARLPAGGHKHKNSVKKQKEYVKKRTTNTDIQSKYSQKYSIKKIINNDNLCALRAILLGKAYVENHPNKYKFTQPNNKEFNDMVNMVANLLQLNPNKMCGIEEIVQIEKALINYQITVIKKEANTFIPVYIGPPNKKYLYTFTFFDY
jgi:hypothetical protein